MISDDLPVSDPVPAVVGIAITFGKFSVFARVQLSPMSSKKNRSFDCVDINAIAFPASSELPPPTAITPSF